MRKGGDRGGREKKRNPNWNDNWPLDLVLLKCCLKKNILLANMKPPSLKTKDNSMIKKKKKGKKERKKEKKKRKKENLQISITARKILETSLSSW